MKKNSKKWGKAFSLMTRDYITISKQDILFFVRMTKKEELAWERETIQHYYDNCTEKQMDTLLELNTWEV